MASPHALARQLRNGRGCLKSKQSSGINDLALRPWTAVLNKQTAIRAAFIAIITNI
jgi:hypothetical protein